jgi:hypothetical protein
VRANATENAFHGVKGTKVRRRIARIDGKTSEWSSVAWLHQMGRGKLYKTLDRWSKRAIYLTTTFYLLLTGFGAN